MNYLGLHVDANGEDGDEDGLDVKTLGLDVDTLGGDHSQGGGNADTSGAHRHGCTPKQRHMSRTWGDIQ